MFFERIYQYLIGVDAREASELLDSIIFLAKVLSNLRVA